MGQQTLWYCVNQDCGKPMGEVVGGELKVDGVYIETRGPNLVVTCPHCGTTKVWYTSDRLYRSITQLIDSIAEVGAKRMLYTMLDEVRALEKTKQ